jgi:hypothetical protein
MTRDFRIGPVRVTLALLLLAASGSSARAESALKIFFAESPAFLVPIDGNPVYKRIDGTDLQRIVNTRALIVRDSANIHYLKVLDGWMEAYELMGEWSVSGVSPFGEKTALERTAEASTIELLDDRASSNARRRTLDGNPPAILISSRPAALVVTDGPPRFERINGTSLQHLANTAATVFREPTDQQIYVRIAGRWFSAWTTDGPWEVVSSDGLPADIAKYAGQRLEVKR